MGGEDDVDLNHLRDCNPDPRVHNCGGMDIAKDYRKVRRLIGLVPQEIALEPFETVINSVRFSRGLFGCAADDGYLDTVLKTLSLYDKKHTKTKELSGGMKRRVLIAKALSHAPRFLFLDEPPPGWMWNCARICGPLSLI